MPGDSVIIIPTYNEAQNIQRLISAIRDVWNALSIVIVDDGSPDGTADLAAAADGVHVIRRAGKQGLGTAYVAGFRYALEQGFQRIGGMDADFSHDPLVLPALFALLDRHDVGIGSRYIPGGGTRNWGILRRLLSRSANAFARLMLGFSAHDVTSVPVLPQRSAPTPRPGRPASHGYSFLVEPLPLRPGRYSVAGADHLRRPRPGNIKNEFRRDSGRRQEPVSPPVRQIALTTRRREAGGGGAGGCRAGIHPRPRGSYYPRAGHGAHKDFDFRRHWRFGADYGRIIRAVHCVHHVTTSTRRRECGETPALQKIACRPEPQPPPEPILTPGEIRRIGTYGLIIMLMICPWHSLEEKAEGYSANQ